MDIKYQKFREEKNITHINAVLRARMGLNVGVSYALKT